MWKKWRETPCYTLFVLKWRETPRYTLFVFHILQTFLHIPQ